MKIGNNLMQWSVDMVFCQLVSAIASVVYCLKKNNNSTYEPTFVIRMSETITIRCHTKWFRNLIILYLLSSTVEGRHGYKVFVIERVAPAEVNYLFPKYRPLRVVRVLPDLDTDSVRRQWNMYPRVEIGPGTFKVDAVPRPPMQFAQYLKNLLRIKKIKEDKDKDVNADKDN